MDFTFIHAADLHLDSPLKGVDAPQATFRAFSRIVDLCLQSSAAFLVLSGDLFDRRDRSVRARLALRQELVRLDEAGIRTFIVHGNHDPLCDDSGALGLPPSVKTFGAEWEEVEVRRGNALLCRVQGLSYPEPEVRENLAKRFHRQGPEPTIAVLHANVGGQAGHANYAPCSLADLAEVGLDYWALGHVHTRAQHRLASGGLAVYPGNPQGRHVQELGERGCVVVEVRDGLWETRFVPTDSVRWHQRELDLSTLPTLDALEARAEAVSELGEGVDAHALQLVLVGRGPLHRELADPGALAELEGHLRERLAQLRPKVLLASIRDESRPELDLAALRSGGLTAAVFQAAAHPAAPGHLANDPELKRLETLLKQVGLPPLRDRAHGLLEDAAVRVVGLLAEGEGR